ncbi:MAG: hypothetical protein AABX65_00845 [Nanoarchaeota archaeon]
MVNEYKSFEEKVVEAVRPSVIYGAKLCGNFLHGLYAGTVGFLRAPTTIRKVMNGQSFFTRDLVSSEDKIEMKTLGAVIPISLGASYLLVSIHAGMGDVSARELLAKVPIDTILTIGGITNALSFIYEIGRLPQSKREFYEALENVRKKEERLRANAEIKHSALEANVQERAVNDIKLENY